MIEVDPITSRVEVGILQEVFGVLYNSGPDTGPHRNFMGFGATMNALVGINYLTGFPDKEPFGTGTNYPDHVPNPTHTQHLP